MTGIWILCVLFLKNFCKSKIIKKQTNKKKKKQDFQGGPVVGNPPVKAGDRGSIPALGRPHMPQEQ